jgi:ACS family tartrate transporter-like MFS transporter
VIAYQAVLRKVTWRLLPFMFVLYIMSYLDRINVSFAALQMNKELGFDDKTFGAGAGIFFIGYFLFGIPSNVMVAKFGARRWIAVIMLIWGGISVAMATVTDANSFYLLRFFLGVAEAGFFPGMILYLTYWFPKRERGTAVARFMSAIPVAAVLGGLISAKILAMHGMYGLSGWKWLFIITGAPSMVLGCVVALLLTDGPAHAKWLSEDEKTALAAVMEAEQHTTENKESFTTVVRNPYVWTFAFIYFCLAICFYGFQLWLPQIIHAFGGLSDSETALLTAIPALLQAAGMVIVAWNSDRTGERPWHVAGSAAIAAAGLIASALIVQNPAASLCALSIAAFGMWGTVGPFWALPTARLTPAAAAVGIALINSVGNLGGFVGPYVVGTIKERTHNFAYALAFMAASLVIVGVISVFSSQAGSRSSRDPG